MEQQNFFSLQNILPFPLKGKEDLDMSDIWNKAVDFPQNTYSFIQAPSGTGKTTLIHILYGLRNDFSGNALWNHEKIASFTDDKMARMRSEEVSVIFQDLRLFPELTTWENIEIKRILNPSVSAEEVEEWMEALGIEHKKNAPARTLSYGEQQRTAIIRALVQPFRMLLMDEPFSHLDILNIQKAARLILKRVQQLNAGFILADLDANNHFPYAQTLHL